jgi:hypothetical protein
VGSLFICHVLFNADYDRLNNTNAFIAGLRPSVSEAVSQQLVQAILLLLLLFSQMQTLTYDSCPSAMCFHRRL